MNHVLLSSDQPKERHKERLMRLPDVIRDTGLKRSSIYQKMAERKFPEQIVLGPKSVAWKESDVQDWITRMIEASDKKRVRS